jgi:histidyl-tRNA synthetase
MRLETPPGTRDFLPHEMVKRQEVIDKIKASFESYGFSPSETPAFEYAELLEGKYGEEEKLIYKFEDMGGRKLALRYDLTVPLVRVVAMNQLTMPYKRYCISRVWRFDRPQKGRFREFWQCDVDIVGVSDMNADAEIISCAIDAFEALGLKGFKFKVNNRKVLDELLAKIGISKDRELAVFRALDKLEKLGEKEVRKELKEIPEDKLDGLMNALKIKSLEEIEKLLGETEGVKEMRRLFKLIEEYGKGVDLDLSMVRGLDYYTGPIFEVALGDYGSIAGGGRYDKIIGKISEKEDVPAVGISLGIERIIEVMREKNLLSKRKSSAKVYVLRADSESEDTAVRIMQKLRRSGFATVGDLLGRNFSNQMKYADKLGVEKIVIVGKKDLADGNVTVRDMESGDQAIVPKDKVVEALK